ncbi:MAG: hypothetical protein H0T62_07240 [Parachlamydiaceae bacterium]|nr:hypothetical protein [Parachlamydiaceae bacterium]
MLGYGPTWEVFWESNWEIFQEDGEELEYPSHCCFSDNHYRQIGEVLLDNHINFDQNDPVSVGKAYHLLFPQFITAWHTNDTIERIEKATYLYGYDGISMRTKYSTIKCNLEIKMLEYLQITW